MAKTRMQILLEKNQKQALEREAELRNTSVGHLIREAVDLYQKSQSETRSLFTKDDSIWSMVGTVRGEETDISEEHDHYIYGIQKQKNRKKR